MNKLIAEGITKQFLASFDMNNNCSPVQLRPNEEPINLLPCTKGYWVILEFGKFLRDENGKMIVINEKEAKIGRARYMIQFAEVIEKQKLDKAIEKEYQSLKKMVESKVEGIISQMKQVLIRVDVIKPKGLDGIFVHLEDGDFMGFGISEYEQEQKKIAIANRKEMCVQLATEEFHNTYKELCSLWEAKDYDSLYVWLFQEGLPMLAKFDKGSESDMLVAKSMFDVNNFISTADKVKEKGHLYVVAEVNARKNLGK